MATTRATSYVVTAAVWNAVLSRLTDDGVTFSGAFNGSTVAGTTGTFSSTLAVTGAATFASTIKERGRSTAIGEWIAVTFSSSNFDSAGAGGTGKWTVASGDVAVNRYTLIGKTLIWNLLIANSSVDASGGDITELRVTIPGGFTASASSVVRLSYCNDNGTLRDHAFATASSTYVSLANGTFGTWTTSTNSTYAYLQIAIEIA
jgi:hypothetical protein